MSSLYKLNFEIEAAWRDFEQTGEENLLDKFEALKIERSEKISSVACLIKNLRMLEAGLGTEIDELRARKKIVGEQIKKLFGYLSYALGPGEKFEDAKCKLSWRRSTKVEVPDEDLVPDQYCRLERKVLKEEIEKDLKIGADLPFARLITKQNLQVK